jgi:hypothetical protein
MMGDLEAEPTRMVTNKLFNYRTKAPSDVSTWLILEAVLSDVVVGRDRTEPATAEDT